MDLLAPMDSASPVCTVDVTSARTRPEDVLVADSAEQPRSNPSCYSGSEGDGVCVAEAKGRCLFGQQPLWGAARHHASRVSC